MSANTHTPNGRQHRQLAEAGLRAAQVGLTEALEDGRTGDGVKLQVLIALTDALIGVGHAVLSTAEQAPDLSGSV